MGDFSSVPPPKKKKQNGSLQNKPTTSRNEGNAQVTRQRPVHQCGLSRSQPEDLEEKMLGKRVSTLRILGMSWGVKNTCFEEGRVFPWEGSGFLG